MDSRALRQGDPLRLGAYTIVARLGEGGQGRVFLGRGPASDQVAIKLLHAEVTVDRIARDRFLREVSAAQRVARFCTAQMLDVGFETDRPYIVSEFVDGPSLHNAVLTSGPRSGSVLERLAIGTPPRTPPASSIATSSRTTCCSGRTAHG